MERMAAAGRLKLLRKTLKLNQTEFAKRLGITFSAISLMELGKTNITDQNVKLLCLTFGVSEQWLRTGEGEMFLDKAQQDVKELLDIYSRLSLSSRKMILDLARTMLANEQPEPI
jgi:transcriptional regulator with XRE-family HTH domain